MAPDGPGRLQEAPDTSRWLQVGPDTSRCLQMASDKSRHLQMTKDESRWLQLAPDGSRSSDGSKSCRQANSYRKSIGWLIGLRRVCYLSLSLYIYITIYINIYATRLNNRPHQESSKCHNWSCWARVLCETGWQFPEFCKYVCWFLKQPVG